MKEKVLFTAEEWMLSYDFEDIDEKDVINLAKAFNEENKNVAFFSQDSSFSTHLALKYALSDKNSCSKVIYARFDRKSYFYTDNMKTYSIDCILKESLCRPFVLSDIRNNICYPENYLSLFESTVDENTLVIVDGFDVASASPYLRHLFCLDCKVLVLCEKYSGEFSHLSKVIVNERTERKMNFDILDERQKELLMSLCAFYGCLDDAVFVAGSKSGVFDEDAVRFYLGELAGELPFLEKNGFVKILPSGRIYIERKTVKNVIDTLRPDADNCKTFMKFMEDTCDFRIMQNLKDISAKLYTFEDNYSSLAESAGLLCMYTPFAINDKKCALRLYNLLVSFMLSNLSMRNSACFTGHLVLKNTAYCINLLYEKLSQTEDCSYIYDTELYADEVPADFYTEKIRLELDIIRLCLSFMRNITPCMYKRYEPVFERLHCSLSNVFVYVRDGRDDFDVKMALLDDVIRLCSESFDYFCVIDSDGTYNAFRDNCEKRRITYYCERESDKMYADSIFMGHSPVTLSLYAKYAEYLCAWLILSENADTLRMNTLLKQIHEEKLCERKETLNCISAHYFRIVSGYENYSDIYSEDDEKINILDFAFSDSLEKRLSDNKRLYLRGFDGGTSRGSERFAKRLLNEAKNSKAPVNIVLTVLSNAYPLNDETYSFLVKNDFAEIVLCNKNISNHSLQLLSETLVVNYVKIHENSWRKELTEHFINLISEKVVISEAYLDRMYHAVSSVYVHEKLRAESDCDTPFCDELYKKYCTNNELKPKFCDDFIAQALYSMKNNEKIKISKSLLKKALITYCAENEINEEERLSELFHILP